MRINVGGLAFRLDFDTEPNTGERAFLNRFQSSSGDPDVVIRVRDERSSDEACQAAATRGGDSQLEWQGDDLLLRHPVFRARIPREGGLELHRDPRSGAIGLAHLLRVSLSVRLPARGSLPLHAAGIVIGERGVAFTGRSGAGKTTLASTSPYPVLSDEFVVLSKRDGAQWSVRQSGIWGGLGAGAVDEHEYPLAALVTLARGDEYGLERIAPDQAARASTGMLLVPPHHFLWRDSLELLDALVNAVPVFRLEWCLEDPPWDRLASELGRR